MVNDSIGFSLSLSLSLSIAFTPGLPQTERGKWLRDTKSASYSYLLVI